MSGLPSSLAQLFAPVPALLEAYVTAFGRQQCPAAVIGGLVSLGGAAAVACCLLGCAAGFLLGAVCGTSGWLQRLWQVAVVTSLRPPPRPAYHRDLHA